MTFKLTAKQTSANDLLGSDARHIMLYGGSRSGKTFVLIRAIVTRALAYESRHAVLRYRFNHLKASIIYDTLPKVMDLCFPGVAEHCKLDKSDWFYQFPNGSEIWFGGLDEKERTEKILGQEYATLFLNECSQIPYASRSIAVTRLAQKTPLRNKAYYDCNPPGMAHWTYRLFTEKRDPLSREPMGRPENFGSMIMNPKDNLQNLSPEYIEELEALPESQRRRFLLGQFADASESALWSLELLDQNRADGELPKMKRIVVAVDPSGCEGEEDKRSDEIGVVVVGLASNGTIYVLEDLSGRHKPEEWGKIAVSAYDRWKADAVVGETNYGGDMVAAVIRAASSDPERDSQDSVPFRKVTASRGKHVRAEPVAQMYEQRKIMHAGRFADLEDQLCGFTTAGYIGGKSPDRADALVWGVTSLFPSATGMSSRAGAHQPKVLLGYSKQKRNRRR